MLSPKLSRYLIALLHVLMGISIVIAVFTVVWWVFTDFGPELIITVIFTLFVPVLFWGTGKLKRITESDENTVHQDRIAKSAPKTDRDVLLNKVYEFWIEGVLERTLVQGEWLDLDANLGEVTPPTAARELQTDTGPATTLHTGKQIAALFKSKGPALLILGEPGSGKTTTLLEVAKALLQEARDNPALPIPLVLNLASWAEKRPERLEDWLIERLDRDYGVSKKLAERWIADDRLNFLLDGLDEVPHYDEDDDEESARAACARAINAFWQPRKDRADMLLVVCSRTAEYAQLDTTLAHNSALHLKPLALSQAATYLYNLGRDWDDLRTALPEHSLLREFSKSPLMVNIMAVAYQHVPIEQITRHTDAGALRTHLFEHYTTRCLNRDSSGETTQPYTNEETRHYLAWLARKMKNFDVMLIQIEGLQPTWLDTNEQRNRYQHAVPFMVIGAGGAVSWLGMWIITMLYFPPSSSIIEWIIFTIIISLLLSILLATAIGAFISRFGKLIAFEKDGAIIPVDRFSWLWTDLRRKFSIMASIVISLLIISCAIGIGLLMGSIIGFFGTIYDRLLEYFDVNSISGTELGIGYGLITALGFVLIIVLRSETINQRTSPNQGILQSMRKARNIGLFSAVVSAFAFALVARAWASLSVGLISGILAGLRYGGTAVIQHVTLRTILWRAKVAPLNYAKFLRYTTERHLTRQVGGGFIFRHRLLMEHFAQSENT